mmetsp:Transcript_11880/g.35069  ORF Transcript_11880/g.35069 Transcript_11880/m.35069 type:complete len:259 (+) Transcript_11880:590-1366(+)
MGPTQWLCFSLSLETSPCSASSTTAIVMDSRSLTSRQMPSSRISRACTTQRFTIRNTYGKRTIAMLAARCACKTSLRCLRMCQSWTACLSHAASASSGLQHPRQDKEQGQCTVWRRTTTDKITPTMRPPAASQASPSQNRPCTGSSSTETRQLRTVGSLCSTWPASHARRTGFRANSLSHWTCSLGRRARLALACRLFRRSIHRWMRCSNGARRVPLGRVYLSAQVRTTSASTSRTVKPLTWAISSTTPRGRRRRRTA